MTRAISWLAAAGILVLAGVVVAVEPSEQLQQGPFVVETTLGDRGTGRNIEATISEVRLATVVELDEVDGWRGTTEGVWVVATVTAATRAEAAGLTGFLLIDGLEFRGSERLDLDGLQSWQLVPGIPTTGTVLFEIPESLAETAHDARLLVGLNPDWRLDSVVGTTVDLAALSVESTVLVSPALREAP
jgi:hypothetical protein